jgi:hypothetical protein
MLADRCRETSTTTGTGTLSLAGAVSSFRTLVAGIGTGNQCYYAIVNGAAAEWEVGIGTVTDATPDTLSRTTVLSSSNAGALVNFSAGTKDVFVTLPASAAAPDASYASLWRTTAQSIGHNSTTAVTYDSEKSDTDNYHSTSSNTDLITIPEAGTYILGFSGRFASSATGVRAGMIYKNGSNILRVDDQGPLAGGPCYLHGVTPPQVCVAGDTFNNRVYQNTGGNLNWESSDPICPQFWVLKVASVVQASGSGAYPPTELWVNGATGSDTANDGESSGAPYATLAKALSRLAGQVLTTTHTITIADATYAEAIDLRTHMTAGSGLIKLVGNVTTPANVSFTGTVLSAGGSTITAYLLGPVRVEFEGLRINATADLGIAASDGAYLIIDRCTVTGTLGTGMQATNATIEFNGSNTVSGWSTRGVAGFELARYKTGNAGTLTITGPGTTGVGVHMGYGTQWAITIASVLITITGVLEGFHIGLNSSFQHIGATGTITVDNASTPANSNAVICTDHGGFATSCTIVFDRFTVGFQANSMAYIEYESSTFTGTNLGSTELEGLGGRVEPV